MFNSISVRILIFFGIWAFATLGIACSRTDSGWATHLDSGYRALQMFALNFEVEPEWKIHPSLFFTRFFAALFTVYAFITIISSTLRDVFRKVRQSFSTKRAVLLGYGQVNRMLALALLDQGYLLTVADNKFNEADRNFAKAHDVLLAEFDLNDKTGLATLWLGRAHRIYVACGADTTNLKLARMIINLLDSPANKRWWRSWIAVRPEDRLVGVHIASPKFMYDLNSSEDVNLTIGRGVSFFSLKTAMARIFVQRAQLVQRARDLGCDRPNVVIFGAGEMAEAIVLDALLANVSGQKMPKFTLIDRDDAQVRARFIAHYPHLFDDSLPQEARPDIEFRSGDITTVNFLDQDITAEFDTCDDPVTCWIFACRDDEENLQASLRLQAAMHCLQLRPVPVFKRIWQAEIGQDEVRGGFAAEYFGHRSDPLLSAHILHRQPDWLAMRIHAEYGFDLDASNIAAQNGFDDARFGMHWSNLPINGRRTNRLAGYHLPQKAADLNYDWRGRTQGVFPVLPRSGDVYEAITRLNDTANCDPVPALLEGAARDEHIRWMLDRAIDGWRRGRPRSNRLRLHTKMKPYDTLDAETRRLDLTSLKAAFKLNKVDVPVASAPAYVRKEPVIMTLDALDGFIIPQGATELALHLIPVETPIVLDKEAEHKARMNNTLTAAQLGLLKGVLEQFAKMKTACRFHIVQFGKAPFKAMQGNNGREDPRGLNDWLHEALSVLPPDIQTDFTARPDLNRSS